MLLNGLRSQSKLLVRLWCVILAFQALFFVISAIVVSALRPDSSSWLLEFLTLTIGAPTTYSSNVVTIGIIWLLLNGCVTCVDFYFGFKAHRESRKLLRKSHSDTETIILHKMHRNLKIVLILILVALFMQILHGVLWWIVGFFALLFKYFYISELKHLFPTESFFTFREQTA